MQRTFLLTPSFWVSADPGEKYISRMVSSRVPHLSYTTVMIIETIALASRSLASRTIVTAQTLLAPF
jgi:hypothetical protein